MPPVPVTVSLDVVHSCLVGGGMGRRAFQINALFWPFLSMPERAVSFLSCGIRCPEKVLWRNRLKLGRVPWLTSVCSPLGAMKTEPRSQPSRSLTPVGTCGCRLGPEGSFRAVLNLMCMFGSLFVIFLHSCVNFLFIGSKMIT